ncbi:hypothetical protein CYMTET_46653 [Cymbomonas tetramitiformis]|uniref:Uncharacterized protein n=1 Tax=Cymbomonas tetramitiformis TaxID=36881 RepID=A0AAE0BXA7_9CHLO|nr:hypothetical protein CYMTET_46653 [Cymbomonas tetramitiformis]|eukprot:gene20590-24682_t
MSGFFQFDYQELQAREAFALTQAALRSEETAKQRPADHLATTTWNTGEEHTVQVDSCDSGPSYGDGDAFRQRIGSNPGAFAEAGRLNDEHRDLSFIHVAQASLSQYVDEVNPLPPVHSTFRKVCQLSAASLAVFSMLVLLFVSTGVNRVPEKVRPLHTVLTRLSVGKPALPTRRELAGAITSAPTATHTPTATAVTVTTAPVAGPTDIWIAAKEGSVTYVSNFLANGADIDALNSETGTTVLIDAIWVGNYDVAEFLIEKGADVNKKARSHHAPLHVAAKTGHWKVLKLLLKSDDIKVNLKNEKEETPLHVAAHFQEIESVERLLKADDVDVNAKNKHGRTPLDMCKETAKGKRIQTLIKEYGGERSG